VDLDVHTKAVEDQLLVIGHHCRPPAPDAGPRTAAAKTAVLAQLHLLQRCYSASASALRKQSLLPCGQLIVISRLLLKSLGEHEHLTKVLHVLRGKVGALRRQLLRQVDVQMVSPVTTTSNQVQALCAYCLVTSVSSDDTFSHLCALRLDTLRRQLADVSLHRARILEALRYLLASLRTFRAVLGRPMNEGLNRLQSQPILTDPEIAALESLNLDRSRTLIPEEIRSFVPYFKRRVTSSSEMHTKLRAWSEEACQALTSALRRHLSEQEKVGPVLQLRTDLYAIFLPSYFSTPGGAQIHDSLRQAFNERVEELCQSQVAKLNQVVTDLVHVSASISSPGRLWDPGLVMLSPANGAGKLIDRIKGRHTGISGPLKKSANALDAWISSIKSTQAGIAELGSIRWRDLIEEPDEDEDEDTNEDAAATVVVSLSQHDPQSYADRLDESLRQTLSDFEGIICDAASGSIDQGPNAETAIILLRAIRMSVLALRRAFPPVARFGKIEAAVRELCDAVAREVVQRLSACMEVGHNSRTFPVASGDGLPSPRAFATLRRLSLILSDIGGTDVWSPVAIQSVKRVVRERLLDPAHKQFYVETEFDEAYLSAALNGENGDSTASDQWRAQVKTGVEYWSRTRVLFGLLA